MKRNTYKVLVAEESGLLARGAGAQLLDVLGAVGGGLSAEVEVGVGGVQGKEVDGRGGTSGDDTKGVGVIPSLRGRHRGKSRDCCNEGGNGKELHCDRVVLFLFISGFIKRCYRFWR